MAYHSGLDFDFAVTKISTVVERLPDPRWKMEMGVNRERCVLCTALEGEAVYRLGEPGAESFQVSRGDTMFFLPGRPRYAYSVPENPWRFITTTFDLEVYNEKTSALLKKLPFLTHNIPPAVVSAFQELNSIWTGKRTAYVLKCRSLLENIIYELIQFNSAAKVNSVHYAAVEKIRQFIQEHCDRNFSVDELASMANCSPSHFRMLFKQIVGMTATQYMTTVRIGKAKDLLLSGEMNVSEAAACTGYRDIFYFSRQFKAMTGHPPSYYTR